jgi:arylsulfatase A-like enzyme
MKWHALRSSLALGTFFFVGLITLRLFGQSMQSVSGVSLSGFVRIISDEIGIVALLTLLALSRPRVALVLFSLTSLLYVVSEHHMVAQGVYLRPRNLFDERMFKSELRSCYLEAANFYFIFTSLCFVVLAALLGRKYHFWSSLEKASVGFRKWRVYGIAAATGYTCKFTFGPIAIFVASLWYQLAIDTNLANISPEIGPFSSLSSYPGIPLDSPPRPKTQTTAMNVIVLHVESLGDISGRANGKHVLTAIDRLAETGISWSNAYGVAPYSSRAIVATQSARYSPVGNANPFGLINRSEYDCVANDFKAASYRTAYFTADNFNFYGSDRLKKICEYDVMKDARSYKPLESNYENSLGTDERALFENAFEWITAAKEPFFMTIQTLLPHYPYKTPPNWNSPRVGGRFQAYYNAISYVDQNINTFLDRLKEAGLFDSTIFVLIGDHGEAFEQHPNNRIHALFLYEENMRIPFILSNPILFPNRHDSQNMASIIDIAPTLFELTGVRGRSPKHDGESLLDPSPRRMVFMSTTYSNDVYALRDGFFKFIWVPETKKAELYNLKTDPDEKDNIASEFPGRVKFYINAISSWGAHTTHKGDRTKPGDQRLAIRFFPWLS